MKVLFIFLFLTTAAQAKYSFIIRKDKTIRFKSGHHVVKKPMDFPQGHNVIFSADCNIRFHEGASIKINGSMIVEGTSEKPVQLTSFDPKKGWPGITVTNGMSSKLSHLDMSHMNKGLVFKGGKLTFSFLDFEDIRGPAGIVLDKTEVDGSFFVISKTKKHAIDCINCTGRLLSHQFKNIGGLAIKAPKNTKLKY